MHQNEPGERVLSAFVISIGGKGFYFFTEKIFGIVCVCVCVCLWVLPIVYRMLVSGSR